MKIKMRKNFFTPGSRVLLTKALQDPYKPVPAGSRGTVESVDDIGTIHVDWDDYGKLGVLLDESVILINEG